MLIILELLAEVLVKNRKNIFHSIGHQCISHDFLIPVCYFAALAAHEAMTVVWKKSFVKVIKFI